MVGAAMHTRFLAEGKPGATGREGANYSTWWNGGMRTIAVLPQPDRHPHRDQGQPDADRDRLRAGAAAREQRRAAADRAADVALQAVDRLHPSRRNERFSTSASTHREQFLFNMCQMGKNSIEKGSKDNWTVSRSGSKAPAAAQGQPEGSAAPAGVGAVRWTCPSKYYDIAEGPGAHAIRAATSSRRTSRTS